MILINRFSIFKRKDPDQARFDRLAKRLESPIEQRFWQIGYKTWSYPPHETVYCCDVCFDDYEPSFDV